MSSELTWNLDKILPQIFDSDYDDRMRQAAQILLDNLKLRLDVPYPPASEVGESPHKRDGFLQASWRIERVDDGQNDDDPNEDINHGYYRLVSDSLYAMYLELGTMHMAARPYIWPAIIDMQDSMASAIGDF